MSLDGICWPPPVHLWVCLPPRWSTRVSFSTTALISGTCGTFWTLSWWSELWLPSRWRESLEVARCRWLRMTHGRESLPRHPVFVAGDFAPGSSALLTQAADVTVVPDASKHPLCRFSLLSFSVWSEQLLLRTATLSVNFSVVSLCISLSAATFFLCCSCGFCHCWGFPGMWWGKNFGH